MSSLTVTLARISQLDSLVRTVDPDWQGLGPAVPGAAAAGSGAAGSAGAATTVASLSGASGRDFSTVYESVSPGPVGAFGHAALSGAAAAAGAAGTAFVSPLPGARVSQSFGPTTLSLEPALTLDGVHYAHFHQGLDLAAPLGTTVRAAAAGTVIAAGRAGDGAVIVRLRHADGSETLYGHLQAGLPVSVGQRVEAGDTIGRVGLTGNTTGPHLHFALYAKGGTPIDPSPWLARGTLPGTAAPAASPVGSPAGSVATAAGDAAGKATASNVAQFDRLAPAIPYANQIRAAALTAGVDPLLLAALVNAESSFRPSAVSSVGAMGLTQLMPATARSLGVTNPFDPQQNLAGGARYLAIQLNRFGRTDLALAAYNAGPSLVGRLGAVPDSKGVQAYVARVLRTWSGYREEAA